MKIPHWPIYTGPNKEFDNAILRTKYILDRLGNPHLKLKNVIHVTGTKGKGSTVLYISNILRASGYKVNTYTSPHIYECNERILLNGEKITDEEIYENTEVIRLICEEGENKNNPLEPAMFEVMTCCAFLAMSKNNADFNVIEVGMGAVNDATNVFDFNPPVACVFTPIHLDHTKFLGNKIEDVAWNKSFLMKKNVKNVIMSSQTKKAKIILKNVAKELNINSVYTYGEDYEVFKDENNIPVYESSKLNTYFPFHQPNMIGDYQLINCGCAITTCLLLQNEHVIETLTPVSINEGIKNTVNIVRMQKIENGYLYNKLPSDSVFYVDGAHNQLAAHALATFINEFKSKLENKEYKIVVAIARTKGVDNTAFLEELLDEIFHKPIIDLLICTRANLESIPEPPEIIADSAKNLGFNYKIAHTITEVIEEAVEFAKNQKILLICTGSLYIARDINLFNSEK